MDKVIKILQFIRLVDDNKVMSLTNIALIIVLYRLATTPVNTMDLGALLMTLLTYFGKKVISNGS